MNDLERDFVGDDDVHYEPGDEVDYDDMPGLINCEDNMDHLNIMHLYGDFNRFNDNENDYDCEEIKAELEMGMEAGSDADLDAELNTDLNTDLNTELNTELNTVLKEIEPTPTQQEPDINREIEASPKQTCIII